MGLQQQKDQILTGVLVQNDFRLSLMAPEDLREYAGLTTTVVTCKQKIPIYSASVELIRWSLESMFGAVISIEDDDGTDNESKKEDDDDDDYDPEKEVLQHEIIQEDGGDKGKLTGRTFRIMDSVTVRCRTNYVELEWVGNLLNDGIADALLAILCTLESSPAAVKRKPLLETAMALELTDFANRFIKALP